MKNENLKSELAKFNAIDKSSELEGEVITTIRGGVYACGKCGFKIGCDEKCVTKERR